MSAREKSTDESCVGDARLGEHVIFALHVVQPSTNSKEALVGCKKLLGFGGIDKSDGM
jgi:hypothetical protein